jgi:Domain of unknown function (DUF397)
MPALQPELDNVSWRVPKRCDGGACVVVGYRDDSILVGSTMQANGPYITYTAAVWKKFLLNIKRGDLDHPAS